MNTTLNGVIRNQIGLRCALPSTAIRNTWGACGNRCAGLSMIFHRRMMLIYTAHQPSARAPSMCKAAFGASAGHRWQRTRLVNTRTKDKVAAVKRKPTRHLYRDKFISDTGPDEAASQVDFSGGGFSQSRDLLRSATCGIRQSAKKLLTPQRTELHPSVWNALFYGFPLAYLTLLASSAFQPFISTCYIYCAAPFTSLWDSYCAALVSYPLLTKMATGILCSILGDFTAQQIQHLGEVKEAQLRGELQRPPFKFDALRTSRLTIYGAAVSTPIGHAWFQHLDTHVMPEAMTSAQAVLIKMLLDQLLMSPINTAIFFVVMRCWDGHREDSVAYMRRKLWRTMRANYALWPLAHIINFAFVPPEQRILFCNVLGIIWTAILSTIQSEKSQSSSAAIEANGNSCPEGDKTDVDGTGVADRGKMRSWNGPMATRMVEAGACMYASLPSRAPHTRPAACEQGIGAQEAFSRSAFGTINTHEATKLCKGHKDATEMHSGGCIAFSGGTDLQI